MPQKQNERMGLSGFSEAAFSPDSLLVVDSVGIAGPDSASQSQQEMPISSGPLSFPGGLLPEEEGGGASEREICDS